MTPRRRRRLARRIVDVLEVADLLGRYALVAIALFLVVTLMFSILD